MRTNIDLDSKLVEEAFKYDEKTTKKDLVYEALLEYVTNRKRKNSLDLGDRIEFSPDYNYKEMRENK